MGDINVLPYDQDGFLYEKPKEPEVGLSHLRPPTPPGFRPSHSLAPALAKLVERVTKNYTARTLRLFTYTRLPRNHLRILVIRPGQMDDQLQLDIHSASLDTAPQYQALSYEWGPGPDSFSIILRDYTKSLRDIADRKKRLQFAMFRTVGTKHFLRANVFYALLHLRHPKDPVKIWVDTICINQLDDEEKAEQIAQMADIYNRAYNVNIWLGESNDGSDEAMEFIAQLGDMRQLRNILHDNSSLKKWIELIHLMRYRWFSRRWIIQELVLARTAYVHCGNQVVHWNDFSDAISILTSELDAIKRIMESERTQEPLEFAPRLLSVVEALGARKLSFVKANLLQKGPEGQILERHSSLEYLVSTLISFDSSDPRDTVYGLLSIAREMPLAPIRPNLKKSLLDVYVEFVEYCIHSSDSLDILCRHWAPKHTVIEIKRRDDITQKIKTTQVDTVLPSWISTVDKSEFGTPDKVFRGRIHANSLVGAQRVYYASGTGRLKSFQLGRRTTPLTVENDLLSEEFSGLLTVRGFVLGRINELSPRITGNLPQEVLEMGGWIDSHQDESRTVDDVPDKLWKTLIANRDENNKLPDSYFRKACLYCLQHAEVNGDVDMTKILNDPNIFHKFIITFLKRVEEVSTERKAFLSGSEDQYFGLCPKNAQRKDLVCIIHGCSVPVILRRVAQRPVLGQKKVQPAPTQPSPTTHEASQGTKRRQRDSDPGQTPQIRDGAATGQRAKRQRTDPDPDPDPGYPSPRGDTKQLVCYKLIGECYVHGKMEGEAMDIPGRRDQDFTLV